MNADAPYVFATDNSDALKNWRAAIGSSRAYVCHSKSELEERLKDRRPGQYFLDLSLPGLGGAVGVQQLTAEHSYSHCLAFSPIPRDDEGLSLLKAGVRAYCNRFIDPELLGRISNLVAHGEVWVGASLMQELIRRLPTGALPVQGDRLASLTEREMDIANLVALGENNKVVANNLGISERTVKAHLTSIYQKTKTKDRLQLALMVKSSQNAD